MRQAIKIHLYGWRIAFFKSAAYRFDFFIWFFVVLAEMMLSPLLVILIYGNGAGIGGYGIYQIFLIQGVYLTAYGFGYIFFFSFIWSVISLVREGMLDILLLRPHPLLSTLVATNYDYGGLANVFGGLSLFVYALLNLPAPTAWQWVTFALLFICALAVLFAISVILAGLGIVWVGNSRLFDICESVTRFASYPTTIFKKTLSVILIFVIPIAMLGFLPASVLMGSPKPEIIFAVPCCALFVAAALVFWKLMITRYTSTGG